MKLRDLIPEAQQLLTQQRMAAGHAILIARLTPEDQARAINPDRQYGAGGRGVAWGLWEINRERTFLDEDDDDDWDDVDGTPKPGGDPYRALKPVTVRELERWIDDHVRLDVAHAAAAAPLEFGAVAEQVDAALAAPGRGKKYVPITYSYRVDNDARASERTYGPAAWKRADGTVGTSTRPATG
jgi:hypothetical protein